MSSAQSPQSHTQELHRAEFVPETNDANEIRDLVLALVDGGFDVETVWHNDGPHIHVYKRPVDPEEEF